MFKPLIHIFTMLMLVLALPVAAAERMVLQLKWEHEFQFAGYYAALWQGYYKEAGLEVTLRSAFAKDGQYTDPQAALIQGSADFAIGGVDILAGRDKGHALVILAPVFQKTPGAIVTLANTKLRSLRDLAGLRIAVNRDDYITREFQALLGSRQSRLTPPQLVDEPLTLDTLLNGRADALLTYGVSAQEAAYERGLAIRRLNIADAERVFYGDTLYTHQRVIDRSPDAVQRFVQASLRGWEYAMQHRDEMAAKISSLPRYQVHYASAEHYNAAFARQSPEYMFYPNVRIGQNEPERWQQSHHLLKTAGLVAGSYPGESLFFSPVANQLPAESRWNWIVGAICAVIVLTIAVLMLPARISAPLVLASVLIPVIWIVEHQLKASYLDSQRRDVWNEIVQYRQKLEEVIHRNFALLRSVVGMISAEPTVDQQRFSDFVGTLIDLEPLLINIAAAPDLTIKMIYPLAGNQKAIGLNYHRNEVQRPMVELARDSRSLVVAGPLELVQGGRAIIGRAPVFLNDVTSGEHTFWGIVSAPIDFDGLLDNVGLNAQHLLIDIALRHGNQRFTGESSRAFFGAERVFATDPVIMPVSLGAVEWEIAATPIGGWGNYPPLIQWLKLVGLLTTGIASLILYTVIRQFQSSHEVDSKLQRNEGILRRVGRIADVGGWELDLRNGQEYVSSEVFRLHGVSPIPLIDERPRRWLDRYDEANRRIVEHRIQEAIQTGEAQHFELLINEGGRSNIWLRHMIEPVWEGNEVVLLQGVVQDISAIRRADATIARQAMFDPVTNLPNRNLFTERLAHALQSSHRERRNLAVLFIDLDHFKNINDSLGHSAGDALLAEIGQRFRHAVRGSDTVARLGGDEFTILLDGIKGTRHCALIADNLVQSLHAPAVIDGHQVFTTASIGVSLFPEDGRDVTTLLQHADQAMYAAKAAGRNTVRFFTESMQLEADRRHSLHTQLACALQNDELSVHYQPIIDIRSGQVAKCEALLRWGSISPAEFIPIAEETGMIAELGQYVMLKSCQDLADINRETGGHLALAFNKSTREFADERRHHQSVLNTLKVQDQFPNITVEITENLLMQDQPETIDQLCELRNAGIKIAIDDFGTGFSSLSYLRKFPVDIVKIDKSFVHGIETDFEARALVKAIISMAHSLKIDVVAEGVETAGQLAILQGMNCRYVQGFYFSPALPKDQIIDYVRAFQFRKPMLRSTLIAN